MSMRDLVTGGAGCSAGDASAPSSSSANPLGNLADALLGSAAKTQDRVRELPSLAGPSDAFHGPGLAAAVPDISLPGFEHPLAARPGLGGQFTGPSHAAGFMRGFRAAESAYDAAWSDASATSAAAAAAATRGGLEEEARLREFDAIFQQQQQQHAFHAAQNSALAADPASQQLLHSTLHSFLGSSHSDLPFAPQQLPPLPLSEPDSLRIRNRSSILARHLFADKGLQFADAQVSALLHSLHIDSSMPPASSSLHSGPMGGRFNDFNDYWHEAQASTSQQQQQQPMAGSHLADGWAAEFAAEPGGVRSLPMGDVDLGGMGEMWGNEFNQFMSSDAVQQQRLREGSAGEAAAQQQAQRLVQTLSQNADPKFQNSKFLQFVSKMSRGEVDVASSSSAVSSDWAREFDQLHHHEPASAAWADEFVGGLPPQARASQWADEFGSTQPPAADWADEFGRQLADGGLGSEAEANGWLESYDQFVEEQLQGEAELRASGRRWMYSFADSNPYVGTENTFQQGQELFQRGLLSEAVLALEAEVLKNDSNAAAWRLLGIAHAENDDDRQAIAAMSRAREADPSNLDTLLALGVSHTNELEQVQALTLLRQWLQSHPKFAQLLPADSPPSLSTSDIQRIFTDAARLHPEDADIEVVRGVLFNLSREYDRAKDSFRKALVIRPSDYSLWNKLGATMANSAQSSEAVGAYQKALELKPNYVRAWTNMGIAFANQARYEESIRYYVRALSMNPSAENGWQYLRIALNCAGKGDMMEACERRDIEKLQAMFPLQP